MGSTYNTFKGGTKTIGGSKTVWENVWGVERGGYTLDESEIVAGRYIPAGTLVEYDKDTRIAKVAVSIENDKNYGLTYQDVIMDENTISASVAVVWHGSVYENKIPTLPTGAKEVLGNIHFA